MGSQLRSFLLQLLAGLEILRRVQESRKTSGSLQLSSEDRQRIRDLIGFLDRIGQDTHGYVTGQRMSESELGRAFVGFLTTLSLTQDSRLAQGPLYAVQNVPLDNTVWPKAIKNFDSEHEEKALRQLDNWKQTLNELLDENTVASGPHIDLSELTLRLEKTATVLERALK